MDAQTFLDNFATVADAPGGVQRLRDLVLELAVRGRLVEQVVEEHSASTGLVATRAEKGTTLTNSIRRGGSVPRIPGPDEHGDEVPRGWEWARLDDTGEYVNGLAFKNSDWKPSGIPIIRIQNLTNPSVPFNYADGPLPEDRMAHDGDILVSWSATLNAFRWNRGDAAVNQHIFKVVPDHRVVTADFLFHLLRHSIRAMAESEAAHGLVMKHINRGPFLSYVVALPPLAEQEKIVAKVDELMGLCHELEARQERRHLATTRFRGSALHALTEAETPHDLRHALQRASANWPTLLGQADSVPGLKGRILQLAARGHLLGSGASSVDQGEPLESTGLEASEQESWPTVTLPDIATWATGYGFPKRYQGHADLDILFCKVSDMNLPGNEREIHTTVHTVDAYMLKQLKARAQPPGTVIFPKIGGAIATNKRRLLVRPTVIDNNCLGLIPRDDIDQMWLYILMSSIDLTAYQSGTSMPSLSHATLSSIHVKLPPLKDQRRIVYQVENLLSLCDAAIAALRFKETAASDLADGLAAGLA